LPAAFVLLAWLGASESSHRQAAAELPRYKATESDSFKAAADAYTYGFPLVLMDVTRRVQSAAVRQTTGRGVANQFVHSRAFPDYNFRRVVSPNADTLYSGAWLDLKKGPVVLSLPETGKRYYLMQMMDAWTNVFACPGTRTSGAGKGDFAIVGPDWKGKLPDGVKEIRSPTNMVWLLGRTQTNGKADYEAVHAVQEQYKLTPLSSWKKAAAPPDETPAESAVNTLTPPNKQVAAMSAGTFFARLNALMRDNPPSDADAPALKRFAAIGVAPGKPFDVSTLDPGVARDIERGVRAARESILTQTLKPQANRVNGWNLQTGLGRYGTDYALRAATAQAGLGANLPEDALYPWTRVDADGRPLTGANRYVLHFAKGQLPPVSAFWSVTLYNPEHFFVDNPIGRYAIGDRDPLKFDEDGSLTLFVQHESPGRDRESNWLPAPEGEFNLIMRLYWPKNPAADGTWKPPAVTNATAAAAPIRHQ
jgi:hypothetical protein